MDYVSLLQMPFVILLSHGDLVIGSFSGAGQKFYIRTSTAGFLHLNIRL
jgi:hypothetical protein